MKNIQVLSFFLSPRILWAWKERKHSASEKARLGGSFGEIFMNMVSFDGKDFVSYVVPPAFHNALC